MDNDLITVSDAAIKLKIKKQSLFKVIKRFSLKTIKQNSSNHRGQLISYITQKDFDFLINNYSQNKKERNSTKIPNLVRVDHGVFYLIQLEPDYDPHRFKLGFTSNLPERLRAHRCSAPFATVIETWPCHLLWEKTAIDSITQGCKKLYTEVFRAEDITQVKTKCDQFFVLMPLPEELQ